jgi:subtilisin family serine protease
MFIVLRDRQWNLKCDWLIRLLIKSEYQKLMYDLKMHIKNKFILLVKVSAILIFLSIAFLPFAGAVNNLTSPQVESFMLTHEKVPLIIMLKDKPVIISESKEWAINSMKSHASSSQQKISDLLNNEKGKGRADKIKQFWIVNAIAVRASPEVIKALLIRDDVESIELDSEIHILEDLSIQVSQGQISRATNAIKRINATKVWELGIDGTGINVSVIDTGIYATHPDIAGRVIKGYDFVNNDNDPVDDHGHGTHVAGTVGGNGNGGTTTGMAPNVSLFAVKVLDASGSGLTSSAIDGIQWSVNTGANVLSLSFGSSTRNVPLANAVNNAINNGVVVIAAAGNCGPGGYPPKCPRLGDGTIEFPGGEKNVIAVGAVDGFDVIASFSSTGPITIAGEVLTKPDVSAPGVNTISLYYLSNGYTTKSGTSMATPHVSGAAALLLQASRHLGTTLSPAQIKSILENTSLDLGFAGKDNTYGAGRIDVFAAIKSLDKDPPSVMANPVAYYDGKPAAKNGETITINATITDSGFGIKNATVNASSINSSIANVILNNISGFWINNSVIVNASSGIYHLNITSYDNISNINNTVQLTVNVDNTPSPLGFINGTVMDSVYKTGISGVMVSTDTSISTITNATGFYSFAVTSGTYDLTAKLEPMYYANNTIWVSTAFGTVVVRDIELLKKQTGNISGMVT